MPIRRSYVLETLVDIITDKGGIDKKMITEQSSLCRGPDSLGLDSLVVCEIVNEVEERFEPVFNFYAAVRKYQRVGQLADYISSLH